MEVAGRRFPARSPGSRVRCAIVSSRKRMVSRSSRSPICCETKASRPRVSVIVFLRSAPAASTLGPSTPRSIGSGTKPRARRMKAGAPSRTRITESSARTTIWRARGRRRGRRSAARRRRASSSSAISGSPPRLALVATSAISLAAWRQRSEVGRAGERVQAPASAAAYRRASGRLRRGRARRSARGRRGCAPARSAARAIRAARARPRRISASARRARRVGDHHGERLGLARLAPAQLAPPRLSLRASQMRWKPPRPLSATMPPVANAVGDVGDLGVELRAAARQAIGSAWKRRLAGSA